METIDSDLLAEPNIDVPRLTFNRTFSGPNELSGYAEDKDDILNTLNDAIAENPAGVLEDIAWLEDQLADGTPIETRPFIAIKEGRDDEGWSTQRPYIGAIRDALSITSNGSQFEFGDTPQKQELGWATIFDKCNEIDHQEIAAAQARVHETQSMVRRYRNEDRYFVPGAEANLGEWETRNTVAKQQRALIRLRSLAIIAHGPELEIPAQASEAPEAELVIATHPRGAVARAAGMVARAASMFSS
jgi:hypothetical protein